jgi:hypothetical protein
MMSGDNVLKASEKISEHINSINDYVNITNTKFVGFKEEFLLVADLPLDSLKKLTQQETFDAAYLLYGYATYIQDEINKNKIALSWCHDEMEKMIVRNPEQFGQYTKHESKKYILAQNNSYAASLENMRQVAEGRLQALEGKVFELKRKADILLEKGKRQ